MRSSRCFAAQVSPVKRVSWDVFESKASCVRRDAGQRFGELVALRLRDPVLASRSAQLVGLVEYDQIVGRNLGVAERREGASGRQGVERDDYPIAVRTGEGVRTGPGISPGHDAALQPKQSAQLAFPVADEPGRRDDQHAADALAEQHLPQVEPRHDGLARAGVVGKQETQRFLGQHPLVHRDTLVGKRFDPGGLAREGGVELVPMG